MARRLPQLSRGSMALVLNALLGLLALGLAFAPPGEGAPKLQLASAERRAEAVELQGGHRDLPRRRDAPRRGGQRLGDDHEHGHRDRCAHARAGGAGRHAGPGGGKLSSKLELLVIDVTTVARP